MKPTPHIPDRHRRLVVSAAALLLPAPGLLRAQQQLLHPTPKMTEGPFYPDRLPADRDADLASVKGRPGTAQGQILYLNGRILDQRGRPVSRAGIELWQANANGRYINTHDTDASGLLDPNFQGYGAFGSDVDGRYRVRTVLPGPYPGRTRHLHFKLDVGRTRLTTQMFFEGERGNEQDGVYAALDRDERRAATGHYVDRADGMEAKALAVSWDIVLGP